MTPIPNQTDSFVGSAKNALPIIIIGGGPSGLSCAFQLRQRNIPFLLLEGGEIVQNRSRYDAFDSYAGIGGAGLYSDGKFSFYPAATNLWKLDLQDVMDDSADWVATVLKNYNLQIPERSLNADEEEKIDGWSLKSFPCGYISLEERISLIENLHDSVGRENVRTNFMVTDIQKLDRGHYQITGHSTAGENRINEVYLTSHLILAGGRFASLQKIKGLQTVFRRVEFGARVQGPSNHPIYNCSTLTDPKYMFELGPCQYRTFCWCRRGEVVMTSFQGLKTYSGRADCERTDVSNFGFNTRVKNELLGKALLPQIFNAQPFCHKLSDFLENPDILKSSYGLEAATLLHLGLNHFIAQFPGADLSEFQIFGPTIEGIGDYYEIDSTLKIPTENIHVIGDTSGIFRGIVAAMISGHYVGTIVKND